MPGTRTAAICRSQAELSTGRVLPTLLVLLLWMLPQAVAGPPFETDDPFSLPYHTGEFYLFAAGAHTAGGTALDAAPAIETNYSFIRNTFFHLVAPLSLNKPAGEPAAYGPGDTEIGFKWRFKDPSGSRPVIGVFPFLEIPTGNKNRGLGDGKPQVFLPVWLGKEMGRWTTYGGGGYWIHPGEGNRNWWFTGILVQRRLTDRIYLGAEVFHQTAGVVNGSSGTGVNAGGGVTIGGPYQALFSFGRNVQSADANRFSFYVALYRTF